MKEEMVIGLLFPGDMGLAVAELLLKNNFRVITTTRGRSQKTIDNIKDTAIQDFASLHDVVEASDIILSINSPNKSFEIAEEICNCISDRSKKKIFIDLNSNTPESAIKIDQLFTLKNAIYVNGAVLGASKDMDKDSVIVLSGRERKQIIKFFDGIFNTKDAGEKIESASAYKLLFSLVNKGINAVFFEAMASASHYGIVDELITSLQLYLPGTFEDLEKTTPTYISHIERRIHEMQGLSDMQNSQGLPSSISSAAAKTFEIVNESKIFSNTKAITVLETFQLFKNLKEDNK